MNLIGWNGNLAVFVLFGFYSVIGGWIIIYIGHVILQMLSLEHNSLTQISFEGMISNPWITVVGQGIFIALTMVIVMLGVEGGLEKASKIMMPLLFIFLLIIVIKSLTLDGALGCAVYFATSHTRYFYARCTLCARPILFHIVFGNDGHDYLCKLRT